MNSKLFRYTLGFTLLGLIIFAFYFSKIALLTISIIMIIITMIEYRNMFKEKNIFPIKLIPEITGILFAYIFVISHDLMLHQIVTPIFVGATIITFISTIIMNKKPYLLTSLSTIIAFIFIFLGLYIIKLTYFFNDLSSWHTIVIYFLAVLSGDFFASKIGPKFTKQLSTEISPNKTIAGAITNLIVTCIVCLSFKYSLNYSILNCLILGVIISIFSQFGDLTLSMFKRDLGLKHSGNLFLDYGGILDRMDAFLFSAPATYYFLYLIS
ncbi:MAG: phosphatidate cytidylyltransferase [Cyanobacteria bacterium SIG29]|nr:phosphatidate cytidylyltransferase [Cyanobacteria bacterium SIG29]